MAHDRFGNLVDDEGHDILEDDLDEEFVDLDEIREADWDDDFDPSLEYPEEFYNEPYDSDLWNEH